MFKENLKNNRELNKLTQKSIAKLLNISTTGYASWEQGLSQPNIENLIALANLFDITIDELVGRDSLTNIKKNNNPKSFETQFKTDGVAINYKHKNIF